jgi:hypothetical protein
MCNNVYTHLTIYYFIPQVKNKPYRLGEEYAFILEIGAVVNTFNEASQSLREAYFISLETF